MKKPAPEFTESFTTELIVLLEKNYQLWLNDFREDLEEGHSTDVVEEDFLETLYHILADEELDQFSPIKYFWLGMIDDLVRLIQIVEDCDLLLKKDNSEENILELEEDLDQFWAEGELNHLYQEKKELSSSLEATLDLLPILENSILAFYLIHINSEAQEFENPLLYFAHSDFILGHHQVLLISEKLYPLSLQPNITSFPMIPLAKTNPKKGSYVFTNEGNDVEYFVNKSVLNIQSRKINLLISSDQNVDHAKCLSFIKDFLIKFPLAELLLKEIIILGEGQPGEYHSQVHFRQKVVFNNDNQIFQQHLLMSAIKSFTSLYLESIPFYFKAPSDDFSTKQSIYSLYTQSLFEKLISNQLNQETQDSLSELLQHPKGKLFIHLSHQKFIKYLLS